MKTREKILMTSLLLFNEEGESHVTTVDIANEMDISPGNLYYHFKGKDVIIDVLYNRFDTEITEILQAPINNRLKLEDNWYYLYVVLEQMHHYRFIYQNIGDFLHRYESIRKRFRKLLALKKQTTATMLRSLVEAEVLAIDEDLFDVVVDNVVMTLTYWLAYSALKDSRQSTPIMLHKGVFQLLSLLAPFLCDGMQEYRDFCQRFYQQAISNTAEPCSSLS